MSTDYIKKSMSNS